VICWSHLQREPTLYPADRAHLQRWLDDDRTDEEWEKISGVAREHGELLLPNSFIREVLAARAKGQKDKRITKRFVAIRALGKF
jgi:ferric-dicitrate binding protein FerR (iron transport regulator)